MLGRALPIVKQLCSMLPRPFYNEAMRASGKLAAQALKRLNRENCSVLGVLNVKMRNTVLAQVHPYHQTIEPADLGHPDSISRN
jgi:hypothetical protein